MPTYTVKAGDSLSKIAKAHGISDWRTIYNDPANSGFRSLRPNPNLIQPGDTLTIPGGSAAPPAPSGSGSPTGNPTPEPVPPTHQAPTGPPPLSDDWIVLVTDGTCSAEGYNTTYKRDEDGIAVVNGSDEYTESTGPIFSNRSYCRQFHDDAMVQRGNKKFMEGGNTAGLWVMDHVSEATSYLAQELGQRPSARICLVGHSRGGMVAILIAKWLQEQSLGVDFLGLYDAVDRAPNTQAAAKYAFIGGLTSGGALAFLGGAIGITMSEGMDADVIPSNVRKVRHAIRSKEVGSRWWFGNCGTEWENSDGSTWMQEFRTSHGAIGGSVPHGLVGQWYGFFASDTGWSGQDLTETENTMGGEQADAWIREGAREAGVPV